MPIELHDLTDDAWAALVPVLAQSFNAPEAGWSVFRARVGDAAFRVAHDGGRVVGGYAVYDFGQRWQGRDVRLGGIAGVGVAPDARGRGVARAMMVDALTRLRAQGVPVAGLYPASWRVYRAVGYDHAGERTLYEAPAAALARFRPEAEVTPVDPTDPAAHAAFAARYRPAHGNLVRNAAVWGRLTQPYVGRRYGWLVGDDGYVILGHAPPEGPHWDLEVVDLAAPSAPTARTVLSLLGGHRSMVRQVRWFGSPADGLASHLDEPVVRVVEQQRWMLRLVDLPAALRGRGWPEGAAGTLHLRVEDELFPDQAGAWTLEVADGRAEVRRGGPGTLRLSARALGPLYSGYLDGPALVAAGLAEGDAPSLATASRLFAAPTPWMREMY